jgi:myo-inositol catabolism protein IolC
MKYGYPHNLYVLPFDHRGSFSKGLFGEETPSAETQEKITLYKEYIYQAIQLSETKYNLPKESLCVLVDEIYGSNILRSATAHNVATMQTVEKSGQEEFEFEFGDDFGSHLIDYKATFAKALVRYNPEGDTEMNKRQVMRLKTLSDFCHANNIKLLIEPLIPATVEQLAAFGGDKRAFDLEKRATLEVQMIKEIQDGGVECDVWKIEGFEKVSDYEKVVAQARNTEDRANAGVIILGRGETKERVESWILAGSQVPGVIGFAVGRTVFWDPLVELKEGKISPDEAVEKIAEGFNHFYTLFVQNK